MSGKISGAIERYQRPSAPNHYPAIGGRAAMAKPDSTEIWRAIPGWEGKYEVSSLGHVRSLRLINMRVNRLRSEPLMLKPDVNHGYSHVRLVRVGAKPMHGRVARLVLMAFVGPCPDGHEAAHLNGVRTDDRAANLTWATRAENEAHKIGHGTVMRGSKNGMAKLSEADAERIRLLGSQGIRNCELALLFGVTETLIGLIRHRRIWQHVQ